jgi:raffinose/stachyose/melibiose transport system permease protein
MVTRTAKRSDAFSAPNLARYALLIAVAVVILVPIGVAVLSGFKTTGQVRANPFSLPGSPVWSNYTDVLESRAFWSQIRNSLVITLSTTLLVLALASAAGFVFSRFRFAGRNLLFTYYMLGLLCPITIAILPVYLMIRELNLVDTVWGVILPQVAFQLPVSVLILRNFFIAIPRDLEDACYVDGGTAFHFFWKILLPLVRPGLAAVAVLTMVFSWNNFFLPLVILNSESLWTLPLGVMQFSGQYSTDWARVLAYATLALTPAVAFYLIAERQIIDGLTAGSIRG